MRTKKGVITSAKMTGTVTVTVDRFVFHPVYKKRFKRSKKFLADINGHDLHLGDLVMISECAPLSKRKRFKVTEILRQAAQVSDLKEEEGLETAIHREKEAPPEPKKTPKDAKDSKETEEAEDEQSSSESSESSPNEEKSDTTPDAK